MGVREHPWPGFRDGHCADVDRSSELGARSVGALLDEIRPDTVVTSDPTG